MPDPWRRGPLVDNLVIFPGSITDIAGLAVGHATESGRPTGCTVVLCAAGATCGVDVRGAAPGTRETDLLRPDNLVEQAHAVLLAGGSAFGLDAAAGVMRWLEERGSDPFQPERKPAPRNGHWHHIYNADVISMPDKWEYPW